MKILFCENNFHNYLSDRRAQDKLKGGIPKGYACILRYKLNGNAQVSSTATCIGSGSDTAVMQQNSACLVF